MPDIVILNGRLITFDGPDAEALAISNGVITAIGSTAEIREIAGAARVVDAGGATVLPGFIDSHVHLFGGSAELDYLSLFDVFGVENLHDAVRAYSARRPEDLLLYATALDYHAMGDRSNSRHSLDAVISERPFAAMAPDHHTVWANTKALELAGLLHGAKVADGAEVVMADDGTATGELRETGAFGPVLALTALGGRDLLGFVTGDNPDPAATAQERALDKQVLAKGLQHCASYGITGLHNMDGNFYQLELLSELEAEGTLLCRTEIPMHFKPENPLERLEEAAEMRAQYSGDMLWSARVKMFMDGVLDSRTAYMLAPYPGTDTRGVPLFSPEFFNEVCTRADAMGLQISVHAIGDAAVRQTLDGFDAARAANGARDSRHRIEHIEVVHPDDIPRLKALGAVASMQPLHSPRGGLFEPYEPGDILRESLFANAFPARQLFESGAPLIFSTDWPVVPVDVMRSIQGAVHCVELPPNWPRQSFTLREALAACIRDNAWVEFGETKRGRLRVGMQADLVVMDRNIEDMDPVELGNARAYMTICDGRVTYQI